MNEGKSTGHYACLFFIKDKYIGRPRYLNPGETISVKNYDSCLYPISSIFFGFDGRRFRMKAIPSEGRRFWADTKGICKEYRNGDLTYLGVTKNGKPVRMNAETVLLKEDDMVEISGKKILVHEVY